MTILLVSAIVWGVVAFMFMDDYCRRNEKSALQFLVIIGLGLTAIGIFRFETGGVLEISFHDWMLLGFLPISLLYLRLKADLVRRQAEAQGQRVSLLELDLEAIPEKALVRRFRILSAVMWGYAVVVLAVHLWSRTGAAI